MSGNTNGMVRPWWLWAAFLAGWLGGAGFGTASTADAAFAAAGAHLAAGRAAEAAAAYEQLLRTNGPRVGVLYNLGLARLQARQPERALAAWRRASLLDPRAADVRENIAFVLRQMDLEPPPPSGVPPLSVSEWAVLCLVAWWFWGGLLVLARLSPVWRSRTARLRVAAAGAAVLLGAVAGVAVWLRWTGPSAVVVERELTVRLAPASEAPGSGLVTGGREVRVLRRHGDWCEVSLAGNRLGWVPATGLEVFAPEAR